VGAGPSLYCCSVITVPVLLFIDGVKPAVRFLGADHIDVLSGSVQTDNRFSKLDGVASESEVAGLQDGGVCEQREAEKDGTAAESDRWF
jgi:hypothetical protein